MNLLISYFGKSFAKAKANNFSIVKNREKKKKNLLFSSIGHPQIDGALSGQLRLQIGGQSRVVCVAAA
jgi:hypothetical protein